MVFKKAYEIRNQKFFILESEPYEICSVGEDVKTALAVWFSFFVGTIIYYFGFRARKKSDTDN